MSNFNISVEEMRKTVNSSLLNKKTTGGKKMPNNNSTPYGGNFGGGAPIPPPPGAMPPPPMPAMPSGYQPGTNVQLAREEAVRKGTATGATFRPLAVFTDGNSVYRPVFDAGNPALVNYKREYSSNNTRKDADGKIVPKTMTDIRAVKEIAATTGTDPIKYAEVDDKGMPKLIEKKASIKGFLLGFPDTETGIMRYEIVKKSDFGSSLERENGFAIAGTIETGDLKVAQNEIPVMLVLTPNQRKSSDGRMIAVQRIISYIPEGLKKERFPKKNTVGTLDVFKAFPLGDYKLTRVVPLRLYETVPYGDMDVAILDLDPDKKLVQYKSYDNTLQEEKYGRGIMEFAGKSAETMKSAFLRSRGQVPNAKSQKDLMQEIINVYLKDASGNKFINNLLSNSNK